jgi:hypothetical protein
MYCGLIPSLFNITASEENTLGACKSQTFKSDLGKSILSERQIFNINFQNFQINGFALPSYSESFRLD